MNRPNATLSSARDKIGTHFQYLPAYAGFLLHSGLDDFCAEVVDRSIANDIPLLRVLGTSEPDQFNALVLASQREMLALLAANKADEYVANAIKTWVSSRSPVVRREKVDSQDIALSNYIKSCALRKFIYRYTSDTGLWTMLVEEVDRFVAILNLEMFTAYIDLQMNEIREMDEALTKREQQVLEAQEIGRVGSFERDLVGKQSSYTPQFLKILEIDSPDDVPSLIEMVHPDDRDKVRKAVERAFVTGNYECEFRHLRNDNQKIIHSRGKVEFSDGRPSRMVGTITDVTERHRIIKKLQESEALHKQAQALAHIGNWSWQVNEDRIIWSDEMYRIHGMEPQSEPITFDRFISFVHPEDRDERIAEIRRSLQTLEVKEHHFRITTAAGIGKILRAKGEVLPGAEGRAFLMLGTCQDVTREFGLTQELRERERYLEELNQSLQFANQELRRTNEELESFNFIASHDLQEPLRKIQVYSNRILENGITNLPAPLPDYFSRINHASRRMQKLIEDFLAFSQTFKANQVAEEVDLNKVIDEIRFELTTRIEEKGARFEVAPLPSVYAVAFQIKQLLINLVSNSLKYARADVPARIRIWAERISPEQVPCDRKDLTDEYLKISIEDNGIGFEPKYTDKIFELFQRLHSKDSYSGTGIGLALCKKIVQGFGGVITADSRPGHGSVFSVYLPLKQISRPA